MFEKTLAVVVSIVTVAVVVYACTTLPRKDKVTAIGLTKQEEVHIQKTEYKYGDWEAERNARIAEYRQEHNLSKKRKVTAPLEQWMQGALQEGSLALLDRENHIVCMDPTIWAYLSIDSKWQLMQTLHVYFDGYAYLQSTKSSRTLASYSAWRGIKIHD